MKKNFNIKKIDKIKIYSKNKIQKLVVLITRPLKKPIMYIEIGLTNAEKVKIIENKLIWSFKFLKDKYEIKKKPKVGFIDIFRSSGVVYTETTSYPKFISKICNWIVNLDYERNHLDAWHLIDFISAISESPGNEDIMKGKLRLINFMEKLGREKNDKVFLFGTGPSLENAIKHDFTNSIIIVCNTIVKDAELWAHLNPDIFVAGDAIYHFGNTDHAKQFRKDALLRLKESNGCTLFVYPYQYHPIVKKEFEEVSDILIPMPRSNHTDPTQNIKNSYGIPPMGNVLGDLLLPIGCSLSKNINLWGFDGRAPTDQNFWSNSAKQCYPELMHDLKRAHPAFFDFNVPKGNEINYVKKVHGDDLEERLASAEARGFEFRVITKSWTKVFQKRYKEYYIKEIKYAE